MRMKQAFFVATIWRELLTSTFYLPLDFRVESSQLSISSQLCLGPGGHNTNLLNAYLSQNNLFLSDALVVLCDRASLPSQEEGDSCTGSPWRLTDNGLPLGADKPRQTEGRWQVARRPTPGCCWQKTQKQSLVSCSICLGSFISH